MRGIGAQNGLDFLFKLFVKILVKFTLKLLHYNILLFFYLFSKLKPIYSVFIEDMEDWAYKKINKHAHCTMVRHAFYNYKRNSDIN